MIDFLAHLTAQQVAALGLAWFCVSVVVSLAAGAWLDRRPQQRPTWLADDIARHVRECGEGAA